MANPENDAPGYITGGLETRYAITKTDGSPIDPDARYFVLRYDKDPSARVALCAYGQNVRAVNPQLADDLLAALEATSPLDDPDDPNGEQFHAEDDLTDDTATASIPAEDANLKFKMSQLGTKARDPRPLIVKLLELEAIPVPDRTGLQVEALDLWQSQIGEPGDRLQITDRFFREGGRFVKFLGDLGLEPTAMQLTAAVAASVVISKTGGPSPVDSQTPNDAQ